MFLDSLDVGNRALQHCGQPPLASVTEDCPANQHVTFAYDKVRRAELRRNVWRFAVRKAVLRAVDTSTMILVPNDWSSTTRYLPGAVVKDSNGQLWLSNEAENINNTPGDTDVWDMYFGPMTVHLYDEDTTYHAGELVYKETGVQGGYQVFLSLQNANEDDPSVADAWVTGTLYNINDVVSRSGSQWRSLLQVNRGVTPADGPLDYDNTATYSTGQTVTGSNGLIYSSVGNGNIGHDPTTDGGVNWTSTGVANGWSRTPTLVVTSIKWRALAATVKNLAFTYPIGCGPSSQAMTNNVFRLPAGYLRMATQDPKAGSTSALGAPSNRPYDDWLLEGNYIVSGETGPFVFRFVADVTQVTSMDDMFCEGLAARIATAICEPLTQSGTKLQTIASAYKLFMSEARLVNAIEEGSEEPPLDDYLACRA